MESTAIKPWYEKYTGFPYKHLGNNPITGIDCFNLCTYVCAKEKGLIIPLSTMDFCNIVDEDWYMKINEQLFENGVKKHINMNNCNQVTTPEPFDIIFFSIGATNVTNHCALYVGDNKILQTMIHRSSWIAPFGKYYKQYMTGIYRWN